jgi:hypothetical protein
MTLPRDGFSHKTAEHRGCTAVAKVGANSDLQRVIAAASNRIIAGIEGRSWFLTVSWPAQFAASVPA